MDPCTWNSVFVKDKSFTSCNYYVRLSKLCVAMLVFSPGLSVVLCSQPQHLSPPIFLSFPHVYHKSLESGPAPSSSSTPAGKPCWACQRKSHGGVHGCQPRWVVFSPTRQSSRGSFPGKVDSSATPRNCSSEFSPKIPTPSGHPFPFPKKNKLRALSAWIHWTVYPTSHKLICNHFYFLIQPKINLRRSSHLRSHLPPQWTCFTLL